MVKKGTIGQFHKVQGYKSWTFYSWAYIIIDSSVRKQLLL